MAQNLDRQTAQSNEQRWGNATSFYSSVSIPSHSQTNYQTNVKTAENLIPVQHSTFKIQKRSSTSQSSSGSGVVESKDTNNQVILTPTYDGLLQTNQ